MLTLKAIAVTIKYLCASPENFEEALELYFINNEMPVLDIKILLANHKSIEEWLYINKKTGMGAIIAKEEKLHCISYRFKDMNGVDTDEELDKFRKEKDS